MKKIHKRGGKVHPSPAPQSQPPINQLISLLPATVLTLTAALSPEDKLVLAYLIFFSANSNTAAAATKTGTDNPENNNSGNTTTAKTGTDYHKNNNPANENTAAVKTDAGDAGCGGDHGPMFQCNCFRCYISYWVRWDTSPNRELIHEIIEEYEENLFREKKIKMNRASNKKQRNRRIRMTSSSPSSIVVSDQNQHGKRDGGGGGQLDLVAVSGVGAGADDDVKNGNLRRFVSFLGEKIWRVWN